MGKEVMKITSEKNEIETKKQQERSTKPKIGF